MADLPSGTVTFLLTDIEGSVRLWEADAAAMRQALARHDSIIDHLIRRHGGVLVKQRGEGDSRFAVFARAADAVAAALAIQWALGAESWPTREPLRVRMGLHTGTDSEHEGDYYGSVVNRCARLRGIAHGGQVVLSSATAELARDALADGAALRDLGAHRLRGLERPERVFQLAHPELTSNFPPLASTDARPHNLPSQPTALIGRERELEAVRTWLRGDLRLLTLTGPGGVGKTRLVLQAAADSLDGFPDGAFLVSLAPIQDPGLVAVTIAQTLGLREAGGRPLVDALKEYLGDKQMLLVLDNFEQILKAAPLVSDLLAACPRLKLMVTSRARLHLRGEREFPLPPLALPDPSTPTPVDALIENAAVVLFRERARDAGVNLDLSERVASVVAEICARLDGLPLAIELAAARVRLLSPEALLGRLERPLPLLTGGARDLPDRQRTLRDTLAWSYDLLDEAEQGLFRRLAAFVGGCTLDAAEAVCNAEGDLQIDVLEGVGVLVEQSLLRREDGPGGEPRFGMLETIREYGLEQLEASGETVPLRRRHASWFLALAEQADQKLRGPEQRVWLERLESEHDNMRAALASSHTDSADTEWRLSRALTRFWWRRGYLSEGREWLRRALDRDSQPRIQARAHALNAAGVLARQQGDEAAARAHLEESLAIFRELGDRPGIANVLELLAGVVGWQGDCGQAMDLLEESLALSREAGDTRGIGMALGLMGQLARWQGDRERSAALAEESLGLFREVGDSWGIAGRLGDLGLLACDRGDYERATALLERCLAMRRELGDRDGVASALGYLGRVAHRRSDSDRATALLREGLELARELGAKWRIIECLEGLARVAGSLAQPGRSARLYGAAKLLREAVGIPVPPSELEWNRRDVAAARAMLGNDAFAAAWEEGRAMDPDQAVAYALDFSPPD